MTGFRALILKLGGKKFAAMIGGMVALIVVAIIHTLSAKFGFAISDDMTNGITLKITGMVVALLIGQGFADGMSSGATSSAVWTAPANATPTIPPASPSTMTTAQLHDELSKRVSSGGFAPLTTLIMVFVLLFGLAFSAYACTPMPHAAMPIADVTPPPIAAVPQVTPDDQGNVVLTRAEAVIMVETIHGLETDKATLISYNATLAKQLELCQTMNKSVNLAHDATVAPSILTALGGAAVGGVSALIARNQVGCHQ